MASLTHAMNGSPPAPGPMGRIIGDADPFAGLSPVDALKLSVELRNKQRVSPEQATANQQQNLRDLLSIVPGPGNVIAAEDAVTQGGEAAGAFGEGRYGKAAMHGGLSALSAFGAFTGLPTGRMAGSAARGASNRTNIFAGPMAKTADHAALAKAQEMATSGVGRDAIHAQTGWHQGVDGKWRFEIDDSSMGVKIPQNADSGSYHAYPKAIEHQPLFDAYPEMTRNRINFDMRTPDSSIMGETNSRALGSGNKKFDTSIGVQGRKMWTEPTIIPRHMNKVRGDTVHELQHNAQLREGFARGTTPYTVMGELDEAGSPEYRQLYADVFSGKYGQGDDPGFKAALAKLDEMTHTEMIDGYRRTAGEVEARNVAARLNMTAAERRAKAPWLTQDVPDDQQIVRGR